MIVRRFLQYCVAATLILLPLRVTRGAELPAFIRQTNNPAAARTQVVPFIEKQIAALKNDDPLARARIIDEVLPGTPPVTISAQFLDVYAEVLNTELLKLANDPNPRLRLNVAILAAKVAEKADNVRLIPTIVDLLDDPHEGVVSWALKAAGHVLVPAHTAAAGLHGPKLIPAFDAAAARYITSGTMIQNAYAALKEADAPNVPPNASKAAIESAQKLLQARRDLYVEGLPEFAQNESVVCSFLAGSRIFKAQTPAQQFQTVQLISDMTGMLAQYFGKEGTIARGDLAKMIEYNGGALIVIGQSTGNVAKMNPIATPLNQVRATMQPDEVLKRATAAYEGLKTFTAWKDLKPFPTTK